VKRNNVAAGIRKPVDMKAEIMEQKRKKESYPLTGWRMKNKEDRSVQRIVKGKRKGMRGMKARERRE
jgi:hypothetical protein